MNIEEMVIKDYEQVITLWQQVEGVGLHNDCDSKEGIDRYSIKKS